MRVKKRRFHNLALSAAVKSKPLAGRCNYPVEGGRRFCRLPSGRNTEHPGSGYCKMHDGKSAYDPIHRYRGIKNKSVRAQLRELAHIERNVFDLVPEIMLMRGLLVDYVERFYEFREALLAWYKENKQKPRMAVDIIEASHMIEGVSRIIERHHRIERSGSIDLATFNRAVEAMGIIVAKHVRDGKILDAIENEWSMVSLDTKSAPALPAAPDAPAVIEGEVEPDVEES